jgi:predicted component of type VI protein secretion system
MNNTLRTTFLLITALTVIPLTGCNSSDSQTTPTYPPIITVPDDTIDHQGEMKILQGAVLR